MMLSSVFMATSNKRRAFSSMRTYNPATEMVLLSFNFYWNWLCAGKVKELRPALYRDGLVNGDRLPNGYRSPDLLIDQNQGGKDSH